MHLNNELPARPRNGYIDAQYTEASESISDKKVAYGL